MAPWVKDLAMSLLWCHVDSWPWQAQPKKKLKNFKIVRASIKPSMDRSGWGTLSCMLMKLAVPRTFSAKIRTVWGKQGLLSFKNS